MKNKNKYDCLISFHRNAHKPEQARRVETFTYINQDTKSESIAEKIQAAVIGFMNR